jgi:hypothetical protein
MFENVQALIINGQVTVSLELARLVSIAAWDRKRGISRRKCTHCFDQWDRHGRKPAEKPPVFPLSFNELCPMCGRVLPSASFSL